MNNVTELIIIIDKSGSMQPLRNDVIGGFNALIEEQAKLGATRVTTIFFNDSVDFIHKNVDIADIKPLDAQRYVPCGCTALLDAIGEAIAYVQETHFKENEDVAEHTIFSIMTDGLENASNEYSYAIIRDLIQKQTKQGWEFIFQAANLDVARESHRLGIRPSRAFSFDASSEGVRLKMAYCCDMIGDLRKKKDNQ